MTPLKWDVTPAITTPSPGVVEGGVEIVVDMTEGVDISVAASNLALKSGGFRLLLCRATVLQVGRRRTGVEIWGRGHNWRWGVGGGVENLGVASKLASKTMARRRHIA